MPFDTVVQIAAGIVIGLSLLVAATVLLALPPRHRAPEPQAPPDQTPSGAVMAATNPAAPRHGSGRPDPGTSRDETDADDVPPGIEMTPLDGWDVLVVGLILVMALATPPMGAAALAPLAATMVLLDAMGRNMHHRTGARSGRDQ